MFDDDEDAIRLTDAQLLIATDPQIYEEEASRHFSSHLLPHTDGFRLDLDTGRAKANKNRGIQQELLGLPTAGSIEYERRWNRRAKPAHSSWRVDATFIRTRPKQTYLYRGVDKYGKTVESLLRSDRGVAAAQAFFRKALAFNLPKWPRKITLDGHVPSHVGLRLLRREDPKWKYVLVRNSQYLNNIIEQDHRAIKRQCQVMLGFKSFRTAAVTPCGLELAHRIRKRQFKFGPGRGSWSLKQQWERALT